MVSRDLTSKRSARRLKDILISIVISHGRYNRFDRHSTPEGSSRCMRKDRCGVSWLLSKDG